MDKWLKCTVRSDEPRSCLQRKASGPGRVDDTESPKRGRKLAGRLAEGTEILERIFNVMFYDRRVMMSKGFVLLPSRRWFEFRQGKVDV